MSILTEPRLPAPPTQPGRGARALRPLPLLLLVAAALSACAGTRLPVRAEDPAAASTPGAITVPKGVSLVEAPPGPVTFAFGGDVHFEGRIRSALDADPAGVMADIAPSLSSADITMVNLETAITEGGTAEPKTYNFRAPATAFDALRSAGVDVVTMANNHGMDYGPTGLADSLAASDAADFPVVGIGNNRTEALTPFVAEVRGRRVAILAATDVLDAPLADRWTATDSQPGLASAKDAEPLLTAVRAAHADADTVVVFLHWGTEGDTCPNGTQPTLAQSLVDAGADIVVGSHAHRLIGAGRQGDALVAYGLGNFVFYTSGGPGAETGILHVTATGHHVDDYSWEPAEISGGLPRPRTGEEAEAARASWEQLRDCTGLAP